MREAQWEIFLIWHLVPSQRESAELAWYSWSPNVPKQQEHLHGTSQHSQGAGVVTVERRRAAAGKTHGCALQTFWVAIKGSWCPKICHGEQGSSCILCFSSAGERLSLFPQARAAASRQTAPSSNCEEATVVKLWLSWPAWVGRRRRNHLFRNRVDSEVIAWVTSPPLNFTYWHGWSASCSWRIILHFKLELKTFKANLCWLEHLKNPVPPLLFQAVSSCSHLHVSSMEKNQTTSSYKSHCKLRPRSHGCQQACLSVQTHANPTGTPACPACLPPSCCHAGSIVSVAVNVCVQLGCRQVFLAYLPLLSLQGLPASPLSPWCAESHCARGS